MQEIGLYMIITKPVLPYTAIAQICMDEGIKMLQLREKHLPDSQQLAIARELVNITRGSQTMITIDDRPDLTLLSGADCLHLGVDDLPAAEARKIIAPGTLLGLSSHNPDQARAALAQNPDYIGFGPLYPTTTKANPDPVTGLEPLKTVLQMAKVPVVAIGGVFPENLRDVLAAGARTVCLVRHFMEATDLKNRIRNIKGIMEEYV